MAFVNLFIIYHLGEASILMQNPTLLSKRSVKFVQASIKAFLCLQPPPPSPTSTAHLKRSANSMEKSSIAVGSYLRGHGREAFSLASGLVSDSKQNFQHTSDSFIDVAGNINDMAVFHAFSCSVDAESTNSIAIDVSDTLFAEKQLHRALLMTERSYRVDTHLQLTILCNVASVLVSTQRYDQAEGYIKSISSILQKTAILGDGIAYGSSYLPVKEHEPQPNTTPLHDDLSWSNTIFPTLRYSQFHFIVGQLMYQKVLYNLTSAASSKRNLENVSEAKTHVDSNAICGLHHMNMGWKELFNLPQHSALYISMYLVDTALLKLKTWSGEMDSVDVDSNSTTTSSTSSTTSTTTRKKKNCGWPWREMESAYKEKDFLSECITRYHQEVLAIEQHPQHYELFENLSFESHPLVLLYLALYIEATAAAASSASYSIAETVNEGERRPTESPFTSEASCYQLFGPYTIPYRQALLNGLTVDHPSIEQVSPRPDPEFSADDSAAAAYLAHAHLIRKEVDRTESTSIRGTSTTATSHPNCIDGSLSVSDRNTSASATVVDVAGIVGQLQTINEHLTIPRGIVGVSLMDIKNYSIV